MHAPPGPKRLPWLLLALALASPRAHANDRVGSAGLSLGDALGRALVQEPDLQVTRLAVPVAEAARDRDRAAWDLFYSGRAEFRDDDVIASTGLDGATVRKSETRTTELGLTKPLGDGSRVSLTGTDGRTVTNSSFALLNPAYRSGVQVSYQRPLARGSGRDANRRQLRRSELSLDRAGWELRAAVLDLLTRTERAYWTLASAREREDLSQLALDEAEQLLEWSRDRVAAGALARVAVVEAEAAVAARRASRLAARRSAEDAQLALLRLVDPPARPGRVLPALESRPGEALAEVPAHDALLADAFRNHPGYRQALLALTEGEVEVAFARDQTLPRVDLVATMAANGLGADRHDSVDLTSTLDFPSYFLGVSFEVPFGQRSARAELRRQRLVLEQSIRRLKSIEVDLETSIETALRRYAIDVESQAVAHLSVEAAKAKLQAERARYEEGMITADDLLRFQLELAQARASEAEARARTSITAMEMFAAAGTLPERRGVTLGDLAGPTQVP